MKLLFNHISPETAYLVEDYPYGFRLRCKIRYWLEYKKNKGFRLCSQTTNPKKELSTLEQNEVRSAEFWNKPKKSTYSPYGAAMYLDEENHVQWTGLNLGTDLKEAIEWMKKFGCAIPVIEFGKKPNGLCKTTSLAETKLFFATRLHYEQMKQDGKMILTTTFAGEKKETKVEPEFSAEEWKQIRSHKKAIDFFNQLINISKKEFERSGTFICCA